MWGLSVYMLADDTISRKLDSLPCIENAAYYASMGLYENI